MSGGVGFQVSRARLAHGRRHSGTGCITGTASRGRGAACRQLPRRPLGHAPSTHPAAALRGRRGRPFQGPAASRWAWQACPCRQLCCRPSAQPARRRRGRRGSAAVATGCAVCSEWRCPSHACQASLPLQVQSSFKPAPWPTRLQVGGGDDWRRGGCSGGRLRKHHILWLDVPAGRWMNATPRQLAIRLLHALCTSRSRA